MRTLKIIIITFAFIAAFLALDRECMSRAPDHSINIRAAAGVAQIEADDSMIIGGSIFPHYFKGQEAELRASALVIEGDKKVCIVSCDVLMLTRDALDEVCRKIEAQEGIPFGNILISATHTHHAPTTRTIYGNEGGVRTFIENVKEAILSAVHAANNRLDEVGNVDLYFRLGQECTVGQNSRLLLSDGTIYWSGTRDDIIRPTGPFDSDLPVLAFKKSNGGLEALLFNHSTHTMGTRSAKRSPAFYGLAAQELEDELGGTVIFATGASGSTHDISKTSTDEKILRIKNAIKDAYSKVEKQEISVIQSIKNEFDFKVREFDEGAEDKAVSYYCTKHMTYGKPEATIEAFRERRRHIANHQGEVRKTWLQVMRIGDIALVGVPAEFFTVLGIDIKRRSPFRYTYIIELANDYIGYAPDDKAFDLGGYQVWTGIHSFVSRGTGEAIVDEAVKMLKSLAK